MPGGGAGRALVVRDMVQRFRCAAFLCEVISRDGRGRGQEQPALPRSAGRGRCPGDMMIDWVSPACGDAAAQSDTKTGSLWARGSEPWPGRRQG